ncbi:MAG: hypothetical protein IKQ46_13985 [Bacteroidales bacterium]|nr:hypothetical protein [Bacteroidales bacterium]
MKKLRFALMSLAVIVSLKFSSCGKDDETPLTISQTNLTMVHGDTLTIFANQKSTFSSANPFVATESADGKIEAKHVGQTIVTATAGGQTKECTISVNPSYNLYKEPLLDFSLTKYDIKSLETRSLEEDRDSVLVYTDKKTYLMHYNFDRQTSKLTSVSYGMPNISYAQSSVLTDFLIERYQAIDYKDNVSYFINSDKVDDASMIVSMTLSVNHLQINAIVVYLKK